MTARVRLVVHPTDGHRLSTNEDARAEAGPEVAMKSIGNGVVGWVLVLLFFPVMGAATKAAKPVASQPCSLTFIPRAGDTITSDGKSYIDATLPNGDSSVSCQVSGGNTDSIKLVLSAPKRGTPRSFSVKYNPDPNAPAVTFTDGSYIIIQHATQIAVGTSQLAGAHFRFNGSWFFNWCLLMEGPCASSDAVSVTASYSNNTSHTGRYWEVSTDAPGGDIAQLQDGITNSFFYQMPFKLVIDCPGCQ